MPWSSLFRGNPPAQRDGSPVGQAPVATATRRVPKTPTGEVCPAHGRHCICDRCEALRRDRDRAAA